MIINYYTTAITTTNSNNNNKIDNENHESYIPLTVIFITRIRTHSRTYTKQEKKTKILIKYYIKFSRYSIPLDYHGPLKQQTKQRLKEIKKVT